MSFGNFKICMIMPWSDGHHSCSEFRIHGIVFNDRGLDSSVDPFTLKGLTMLIIKVSFIFRVHDHILIPELRLRTYCPELKRTILKSIERRPCFLSFDFIIWNVGFQFRIPIHDPRPTVYQAFLVHSDKRFIHTTIKLRIHGVTFPRPVATGPHRLHLVPDGPPWIFNICRNSSEHFLPPQSFPRILNAFLISDLIQDHVFCGNRCVIGARKPKCLIPLHSMPADENVFQSQHHGMSHMQLPGCIRRRHGDSKRSCLGGVVCPEHTFVFPSFVNLWFKWMGIVGFWKCHGI